MAVLPICKLPDPVLRREAKEVADINGKLQRLIDDMTETMYAAPGLGLAANQVGELQRLIVFDVAHKEARSRSVRTTLAATTTGSMVVLGLAPCPPFP